MLAIKAHEKVIRHQMRMLAWTQANLITVWLPKGRSCRADDLLGIRRPETAAEIKEFMAEHMRQFEDEDEEGG